MHDVVNLSEEQAQQIMNLMDRGGLLRMTTVKQYNHLYRLQGEEGAFYLKTFTKDWYGDDVARTGGCVQHEEYAWVTLKAHGLKVPQVALACYDLDNPLGRPFIVTRELRGAPLIAQLGRTEQEQWPELLMAIGDYLRRMHAVTLPYPGYIMPGGLTAPPEEGAWQHRCWTARQRQKDALALLEREQALLSPGLVSHLQGMFGQMERVLAVDYRPPRFVHGDCHAHQFFLQRDKNIWQVTGVVDMEVASAGDVVEDLLHFTLEMAASVPTSSRWWEPFFAGYGGAPDFGLFRLRLLAVTPEEFRAYGYQQPLEGMLSRMLATGNWPDLFEGWAASAHGA